MKAQYNQSENTLQEQLPEELNPQKHDANAHPELYDEYKIAAERLRTIPCSPEAATVFKDGEVYEEGKDYEVAGAGDWKWCYQLKGNIFARPLTQPVQEDVDLWKGFLSEVAYAHSQFHIDHAAVGVTKAAEILEDRINELKIIYHLTRK